MKYAVEIRKFEGNEVVQTIECTSKSEADRVDRGVNINLNWREYYTMIVESE